MSKLQSKQEEYVKNKRADTIYRIITNKPKKDSKISPKKDSKTSPKKDSKTSPKKDSKISSKKDLSLESPRKDIIDKKKILLSDLPDDVIKIFVKKYKSLLKYNLREWIISSLDKRKIYWGFFSLNPNAVDFLSLPENKKYIDYSQLSKNTNSNALELIKEEIRINPNNPDIDWSALSKNPKALDILDVHRNKIKWHALCFNTSPRAIHILKENQLEKDNGDDDIYWDDLCLNTSDAAIDFLSLPENYRYIEWNILSLNTNPKAIALLIKKESEEFDLEDREFNRLQDNEKICWRNLSENPNAISLLERKWEEEKELLRNDIKQYNILKKKDYIINWDVLSGNPKAIDLFRDKIEEEKKIPKKRFDRLDDNEKINWAKLSASAEPKVIQLLEENPTKIIWFTLSANPNAIKLLEENPTKINWPQLSKNPKAIKLLKKELKENPENISWYQLSKNPRAIEILDKNRDKIIWSQFSENPNAGELLKDRVEYEDKLPKKKYNELTNYSKLNWIALSLNPSIFTLS